MSWDAYIALDFAQHKDPIQRFVEVAHLFDESTDITRAISWCRQIEYYEAGHGAIVYHKDLVDGRLVEFFEALLDQAALP